MKTGSLGARVGNDKIVVPAEGSAVFPAGVVHAWWNAGEDLLGRTVHEPEHLLLGMVRW